VRLHEKTAQEGESGAGVFICAVTRRRFARSPTQSHTQRSEAYQLYSRHLCDVQLQSRPRRASVGVLLWRSAGWPFRRSSARPHPPPPTPVASRAVA